MQAVGGLLHALPGWPLADGIDRSKYTPDSHQLLVSDMLATNWFQDVEGLDGFARTRVLVADEGGTGKTLGVSLAVRWATIQPDAKGPCAHSRATLAQRALAGPSSGGVF